MTSIQIDIKDGLSSSTAIKGPCRVATTANITLSGEQTIDGAAVVTGDRVLVKDQTTASDNGIYIADTGSWRRAKDFNKTRDVKTGTMVNITSGTAGAGQWQVSTTGDITIGTTNIAFARAVQPYDADLVSWALVTRAAGFDTFTATPSSANLKALLTDETGSGAAVFATSPTLVTPALGTPTALVLTNATGLPSAGVVATATDELRITIGNLAYPARYGTYDSTGVADSTSALQSAVSSKKFVEIGEGTFKISSAINLVDGSKIIGYGRGTSTINVNSTTVSGFVLPSAGNQIDIGDLSILRTGTPGASAHGVVCTGAVSFCKLHNLYIQGHYDGLHLRTTGYSEGSDLVVTNNINNGIYMQNTTGQNAIQWYLARVLAQVNGNHGVFAESLNGGGTQVALGDWTDIRSFANSGAGVAVKGYAGAEVNALRLRGGFLGEDGLACIYLDSRGFGHKIENMFLEIAGTRTTGPTLTTPATGTAPGIQINSSEQDVKVADCYISGNSANGINSNVTTLLRVDSTTFKSNTGYGIVLADGAKYAETNCDFITNTVGARSFTAGSTAALVVGATPAFSQSVESVIASGSAVSLTSTTAANLTSISLPAGVWNVDAIFDYRGGATTTVVSLQGSISQTSATMDITNGKQAADVYDSAVVFNNIVNPVTKEVSTRLTLAVTTTVYAVALAQFGTSTCTVYGVLRALRVG